MGLTLPLKGLRTREHTPATSSERTCAAAELVASKRGGVASHASRDSRTRRRTHRAILAALGRVRGGSVQNLPRERARAHTHARSVTEARATGLPRPSRRTRTSVQSLPQSSQMPLVVCPRPICAFISRNCSSGRQTNPTCGLSSSACAVAHARERAARTAGATAAAEVDTPGSAQPPTCVPNMRFSSVPATQYENQGEGMSA